MLIPVTFKIFSIVDADLLETSASHRDQSPALTRQNIMCGALIGVKGESQGEASFGEGYGYGAS